MLLLLNFPLDSPKPVGTNYSRVNPTKEINPAERDEFWRKEEEEEKHRLQAEYERKLNETVLLEEVYTLPTVLVTIYAHHIPRCACSRSLCHAISFAHIDA